MVLCALFLQSCQTTNPYTGDRQQSKATTGAIIGGLLGLGIGSLTGEGSTDRRQKAMIGAGIGALAGAGIGNYMDQQEYELRRELEGSGVGVRRSGNQISLIMPGDITFATGSATIQSDFYPILQSVGKVLNKFNRTVVEVSGHTDNVGQRDYNYRLSQNRANSVASLLTNQRVAAGRLVVSGFGPDQPIASNDTAAGRQANRRVTLQIAPQ
jgi:outer membrane protein OmpA-like peptidoglycan-associated protein